VVLTITTTPAPATDLGYLLHKHPDRLQTFETATGATHVFYPEATAERCTAALDGTTGAVLVGFGAKLVTEHV